MNHLECVTSKRNKWYWYLLVVFLSFFAALAIGGIPFVILLIISTIKNGTLNIDAMNRGDYEAMGFDLNIGFACEIFTFTVMLIAAVLLIKLFHDRSWKEVINGTNRIRWSRFFFGFLVWGIILLVPSFIAYFTEPESMIFRFDPAKFFVLLFIALIFIPIQASTEEFIFRGYLAQGVASLTKSRWWALIIPSLLFGLVHGVNPEIEEYGFGISMFQYIFWGIMFGLMSIMDDGIELAMGVHTVNNLIGSLLFTYKSSAIRSYALFELIDYDPKKEIIPFVISGFIILAIFAYKYKWNLKIINQKVVSRDINPERIQSI